MHKHGLHIFQDILPLRLGQLFPAFFLQIRKQPVRRSRHADISGDGTDNSDDQKEDKVSRQKEDHNLAHILQNQKAIVVQHRDIVHLMSVHQGLFVNQKIGGHRFEKIEKIDQGQVVHIRPLLHQDIQKWQKRQPHQQHHARRRPVKGPEHPHQDLLLFDILLRNGAVEGIGNRRSDTQLREG